jgi:hypothetical protein
MSTSYASPLPISFYHVSLLPSQLTPLTLIFPPPHQYPNPTQTQAFLLCFEQPRLFLLPRHPHRLLQTDNASEDQAHRLLLALPHVLGRGPVRVLCSCDEFPV